MWKPVLEAELAAQASLAIRDIAVANAANPSADPADRTLFWAYATNLVDEPFAHAAYASSFDDVIASLREGVGSAALHGGLAGIGFTLVHVLDGGAEDMLEVIDEALLGALADDAWDESLDLAHGAVGLGVYFVERLRVNPRATLAAEGLDRVARLLERTAVFSTSGATWLRAGVHDCGVAHGVPGVIGFLSRARRVVRSCKMRGLCEDASRWLRAQRDDDGFPATIAPAAHEFQRFARLGTAPGVSPRRRAAWCYGDPGIAAATWSASPDLARETALACSLRELSELGVRDASLRSGAAGLAHLCNRFYQATDDDAHAAAARAWFSRTLALRSESVSSHGLIDGSIGVALALIAGITPTAPTWDRLLLADLERVS